MKPFTKIFALIAILSITWSSVHAQKIPQRPNPPQLVNDLAGFLAPAEERALEEKVDAFNNRTGVQIAVVVLDNLDGLTSDDMATRILRDWGVGQKDKNNGIVVLLKPKTPDSRGQVFIATGYGVEEFVTDAVGKRIVELEMIPKFKNNDLYGGLDAAVNTLMSLLDGKFTADQYMKRKPKSNGFGALFFVVIFMALIIGMFRKNRFEQHSSAGSSMPFWLLMSMLGSGGGGRSGGFGDFSGGSGGGGFGGFGGGLGGGGGAGGSW